MTDHAPTIWMNVTTSANWTRPAVGIIRVEQAIWAELAEIYGSERFKLCVWDGADFTEWQAPRAREPKRAWSDRPFDGSFPTSRTFDPLKRIISRPKKQHLTPEIGKYRTSHDGDLPSIQPPDSKPRFGDILISVGLDWDHSYTDAFYRLKTCHGISVITCCYDLIPVLFPQYCVGEVAAKFKEYFAKLTWGSTAVLCISDQTRRDYENLCSQLGTPKVPTHVIPLGDNLPEAAGKVSENVENISREPFLLFVSTIERRKNHEILYRAYHLLCRQGHRSKLPKIVFVGMPGWGVGDFLKDVELDPLTKGLIVQLNHVNDAELAQLYEKAMFCVYPSLYEGWGLPVGEALAMGKAVVASNQGSLPEVGGDLVQYVDPWNAPAWADALLDLIENPEKIAVMENRTHTSYRPRAWSDTARVVKGVLEQIGGETSISMLWEPGYDLETVSGMPCGSSIWSTGLNDGYLLHGPRRSLPPGSYAITIDISPRGEENGNIDIFAVSSNRSTIHAEHSVAERNLHELNELKISTSISFNFLLSDYVDDLEILMTVGQEIRISIDKITLHQSRSH